MVQKEKPYKCPILVTILVMWFLFLFTVLQRESLRNLAQWLESQEEAIRQMRAVSLQLWRQLNASEVEVQTWPKPDFHPLFWGGSVPEQKSGSQLIALPVLRKWSMVAWMIWSLRPKAVLQKHWRAFQLLQSVGQIQGHLRLSREDTVGQIPDQESY